MNREIRFRAWNIATKTMIDLKKITPLALNMDTDGLFLPFSDGLPLMQFTGLKDNNHKEIYEGDYISNTQVTFEVFWDKSLAAFRCRRKDSPDKFLYELPIETKYWVSGNIYDLTPTTPSNK